jgi:hypothetical protein
MKRTLLLLPLMLAGCQKAETPAPAPVAQTVIEKAAPPDEKPPVPKPVATAKKSPAEIMEMLKTLPPGTMVNDKGEIVGQAPAMAPAMAAPSASPYIPPAPGNDAPVAPPAPDAVPPAPGFAPPAPANAAPIAPPVPSFCNLNLQEYPGMPRWNEVVRQYRILSAELAKPAAEQSMTNQQVIAAIDDLMRLYEASKGEMEAKLAAKGN